MIYGKIHAKHFNKLKKLFKQTQRLNIIINVTKRSIIFFLTKYILLVKIEV